MSTHPSKEEKKLIRDLESDIDHVGHKLVHKLGIPNLKYKRTLQSQGSSQTNETYTLNFNALLYTKKNMFSSNHLEYQVNFKVECDPTDHGRTEFALTQIKVDTYNSDNANDFTRMFKQLKPIIKSARNVPVFVERHN